MRKADETDRREDHVKMENKIAKEWQQPPEAATGRKGISPRASGGSTDLPTSSFQTSASRLQDSKFLF